MRIVVALPMLIVADRVVVIVGGCLVSLALVVLLPLLLTVPAAQGHSKVLSESVLLVTGLGDYCELKCGTASHTMCKPVDALCAHNGMCNHTSCCVFSSC